MNYCTICGIETIGTDGWSEGNNADPITDGRCCDNCDMAVVLPARLAAHTAQKVGAILGFGNRAFTAVISGDGFILGLADRNERGYLNIEPDITYPNYDVAEQEAQRRNEAMGINPYEAIRIVASSMKGVMDAY